MRDDGQAPSCAGVRSVTFRAHRAARLRPFHRHRHARIQAYPSPNSLSSRFKAGNVPNAHGCLLDLPNRKPYQPFQIVLKKYPWVRLLKPTNPSQSTRKPDFSQATVTHRSGQWDLRSITTPKLPIPLNKDSAPPRRPCFHIIRVRARLRLFISPLKLFPLLFHL
jgi:hypothetical protein